MNSIADTIIEVDFQELKNIVFWHDIKYLLKVTFKNTLYEFIIYLKESNEDILVLSPGFLTPEQQEKLYGKAVFNRHSWIPYFEENIICFNDPTRYDFKELNGGWGIGTPNNWHTENIGIILKVLCEKITEYQKNDIKKYSNVYFYGSSMGGFISMFLGTMLKNSTVIADVPQFNICEWSYWPILKSRCFRDLDENEISKYDYKLNILNFINKEKYIPNLYLLLDCSDEKDWETQFKDFLNNLNSLPFITNNNYNKIHIRVDGKSNGHSVLNYRNTLYYIKKTILLEKYNNYLKQKKYLKYTLIDKFNESYYKLPKEYINMNHSIRKKYLENCNVYRIDIKNVGDSKNTIEIIEKDEDYKIYTPNWFKNDEGVGTQIQCNQNEFHMKIKCNGNGHLKIWVKTPEFYSNKKKFQIWSVMKEINLNDKELPESNLLISHDNPYFFIKKSYDGEILNINIKFDSVFNYFPQLHQLETNINNEEIYEKIQLYLSENKNIQINRYNHDFIDENILLRKQFNFRYEESIKLKKEINMKDAEIKILKEKLNQRDNEIIKLKKKQLNK